jgi:hypothetical protein
VTGNNPHFRQDQTWSLTQGYSFTSVRHRSPAAAPVVFGQVTDGGGPR